MGLVKIALWQSIPLTHLELPSKQRGSFKPLLPDIDSFSEFHSIFRFRPKDSFAQLRILYHYLGFMRIVFVNKKVLQKGSKKVSTFNTQ